MHTLANHLFNQRSWRQELRKSAVLGVILMLLFFFSGKGQIVHAASLTVTTTDDELNADGDCSLREAIQAANTDTPVDACLAGSGADTVVLPAGTYILSIPGTDEDANTTGDLDIISDVMIQGDGAATTIIDGADLDRVLHITAGQVQISDVTIRNGSSAGSGGGVFNSSNLGIYESTIKGSNAISEGGGIFNDMTGSITIRDSTIADNSAGGIGGGGIFNEEGGSMRITGSSFTGNTTTWDGAAIHNRGTIMIETSTLWNNSAAESGGGIINFGGMTIIDSNFSGNITGWGGGAINNGGTATIENSTFQSNLAGDIGGGLLNGGDLTLANITVENNSASGSGGGIFNLEGTLVLYDSKIKDNNATSNGGGIHNEPAGFMMIHDSKVVENNADYGGGIFNGGTLAIYDSMVKDNTVTSTGGGIFNDGGVVTLTDSKVRGNQPDDCVGC